MYSYIATAYFLWKYSYLLTYLDYGFTAVKYIRYGNSVMEYLGAKEGEEEDWEEIDAIL